MKIYKIDVLNLVNDNDPSRTIKADGFELSEGNRIQFYRYEEDKNSRGKHYIASYPADKINIKGVKVLDND